MGIVLRIKKERKGERGNLGWGLVRGLWGLSCCQHQNRKKRGRSSRVGLGVHVGQRDVPAPIAVHHLLESLAVELCQASEEGHLWCERWVVNKRTYGRGERRERRARAQQGVSHHAACCVHSNRLRLCSQRQAAAVFTATSCGRVHSSRLRAVFATAAAAFTVAFTATPLAA
eukprot:scaffold4279_cov99-Isochrysis_galbana.AAC.1